jgi:hypothetical protein
MADFRIPVLCVFQETTMTSPLDQKVRITGPVVVTANRVGDGAVVYARVDGAWTTSLAEAAVTTAATAARALMDAAIADDLHAIAPYVAPVILSPAGEVRPGNLREIIRRHGPTTGLTGTFGL